MIISLKIGGAAAPPAPPPRTPMPTLCSSGIRDDKLALSNERHRIIKTPMP